MTGRHLFVPLERDDVFYYASCNIVNDDSLVYVYLLHPLRGSLRFTLYFDEKQMQYKPRFIVPGLDQLTLLKLNEHLTTETSDAAQHNKSSNYHIHIYKDSYGYLVINRLYKRTAEGIHPTGKFHIFYEQWHELKEFEWDGQSNSVITGGDPGSNVSKLISTITEEMDQQ